MAEDTGKISNWKKIIVGLVVIAVVGIALIAVISLRGGAPHEQVAVAARKDVLVPILAGGTLEPPAGGEIRSPDNGVVAQLYVHEGQRVTLGQPILRLSNPQLDQQVLSSRSSLTELDAEGSRAAADVDQAQREADRLKATVDADARLLKAGAITRQQSDNDENAYRQALDRIKQAQSQVASVAERRRLIQTSTADLATRAANLIVRSPANGVIYNLPRGVGEAVQLGQVIGNAVDRDHLRVRIRVDEPDLPRIQVSQAIVVRFEGLPDRKWDGSVTLVPPGVREVGGRQVGEVIGTFSDPTGALPPNASVTVEVIVGAKRDVLVIPRAALLRDGDRRYVFRYENGHARRVDVKVGLIAPTEVEIASGLKEGDRVLLPGAIPLTDGQSVETSS